MGACSALSTSLRTWSSWLLARSRCCTNSSQLCHLFANRFCTAWASLALAVRMEGSSSAGMVCPLSARNWSALAATSPSVVCSCSKDWGMAVGSSSVLWACLTSETRESFSCAIRSRRIAFCAFWAALSCNFHIKIIISINRTCNFLRKSSTSAIFSWMYLFNLSNSALFSPSNCSVSS